MEFVLNLQKLMIKNNYLIAVRDDFENLLAKSVLKITDKKIQDEPIEVHVKNRIFSVIVECVQNICNPEQAVQNKKDSVLLMNKVENGYQVVAGSRVDDNRKKRLEEFLASLKILSVEEIKEMKKLILINKELNAENQEKLTFIELYLRSDGKINFFFDSADSETHFFMIQIEITNK